MSKVYLSGTDSEKLKSTIQDVFLKSTQGLEWLKSGDLVLLKPALNSMYPYPSTTHPMAVQVLADILEKNGAKVVVGDQSGLRSVLHHPGGLVHGSSRVIYNKSGMELGGHKFIGFEERGWDDGFIHHKSLNTPSWPHGFYVTRCIEKADHIINLPRISTHTQAGASLGFKNMIGLLRDDSRMEYHANGPYNYLIKFNTRKSSLKSVDDHTGKFLEKIVEISDSVREKLRLTLFVVTRAQTTFGPDQQAVDLGMLKIARAHVVDIKPGLVFASTDPVAAETCALALLQYLRKSLPKLAKLYEAIILMSSNNPKKMENTLLKEHPYIKHAQNIDLGCLPSEFEFNKIPEDIKHVFNDIIDEN